MIICRFFGWLLVLTGLGVAIWEIWLFFQTGKFANHSLGQIWFMLDSESLNLVQAGIQRNLFPELWDPGLVTILEIPAWALPAFLGLIVLIICRKREKKRSFT